MLLKLLVENEELQKEVKAMQEAGVVVEACVALERGETLPSKGPTDAFVEA